jgi:hypothetical protein
LKKKEFSIGSSIIISLSIIILGNLNAEPTITDAAKANVGKSIQKSSVNVLWYEQPSKRWEEAMPRGTVAWEWQCTALSMNTLSLMKTAFGLFGRTNAI